MSERIDIGHGHEIEYSGWAPDRELNPQYADVPDVEKYGLIDYHNRADNGKTCSGYVTFDGVVARRIEPGRSMWTVESWEPLTLSPSLLCRACGDHGFIREGKWVAA